MSARPCKCSQFSESALCFFSFPGDWPGEDSDRSHSQREDPALYPSVHMPAAGKPSLHHVLLVIPLALCSRWRISALLLIYVAQKDCFQTAQKRWSCLEHLLIFNAWIFLEPWLLSLQSVLQRLLQPSCHHCSVSPLIVLFPPLQEIVSEVIAFTG